MTKDANILCLNSGSSSLKFAVFRPGPDGESRVADGAIEAVGLPEGRAWIRQGTDRHEGAWVCADAKSAVHRAFELLERRNLDPPGGVGYRVVHGGVHRSAPARIDDALVADLRALVPFAPLHMPASLAAIEAGRARVPSALHVACFDTAFFATLPEVARRLPLPDRFDREGVRRFGFHGLSYEFVAHELGDQLLGARAIIAHLGNGASLAAIDDGVAVDTTMAMTPNSGVVMGTRTGDLDPGVLLYLLRQKGLGADELERMVDREAGLLAVGGTSDMKTLLARRASEPRAALAVAMFALSVKKAIGALAAALGGLDLLVFTGGIGENAAEVRTDILRGLDVLGVCIDDAKNARNDSRISRAESRVVVAVVKTDEAAVIARHVREFQRR